MDIWRTNGDKTLLLKKGRAAFSKTAVLQTSYPTLTVDSSETYQTMDGFGFSLTGGSAMLLAGLAPKTLDKVLRELFGQGPGSIGISALRLTIGASDLSSSCFTYDEMPQGQSDPALARFNIFAGDPHVIPILQRILKINPTIKLIASPWTAPPRFKTNDSFIGGELKPECEKDYAQYFVDYLLAMKAHGITVHAITPQNEPHHPGNEPSMIMRADQQIRFITNHLGPAFDDAGLDTEIFCWDHNCDEIDYPLAVLADPKARKYVAGTALHLYMGGAPRPLAKFLRSTRIKKSG